eukprot:3037155-Amphidinium_carterae.1
MMMSHFPRKHKSMSSAQTWGTMLCIHVWELRSLFALGLSWGSSSSHSDGLSDVYGASRAVAHAGESRAGSQALARGNMT